MAIDKIVFDFGGVLMDEHMEEYFAKHGFSKDDAVFMWREVLGEPDIATGKITAQEHYKKVLKTCPDKHNLIEFAVNTDYKELFSLRPNVLQYIIEQREGGKKTYGLTNIEPRNIESLQRQYKEYATKKYPSFESLFDGITTSYEAGVLKPDPKIFNKLFKDFGIKPSSALFIDDREKNIAAARGLGMNAIEWTKEDTLETIKQKVHSQIENSKGHGVTK